MMYGVWCMMYDVWMYGCMDVWIYDVGSMIYECMMYGDVHVPHCLSQVEQTYCSPFLSRPYLLMPIKYIARVCMCNAMIWTY